MFPVLLTRLDRRSATFVRLVMLVLIGWSVFHADHPPGGHGRGLVITLLFAAAVASGWCGPSARSTTTMRSRPSSG